MTAWHANKNRTSVLVLALFVATTVVMLFPLSLEFTDHVPDWGDPLEHTWRVAWAGQTLLTDPLQLYQTNIFYPYPNTLAFSDSEVATAVSALPITLATGNPILGLNFVFLAGFALTGFSTYLLAYDLTHSRGGALLAGFAFAFWAYRFNQLSHIPLITVHWLPLVLYALRRSLYQDRIVFPILFAVTFAFQALSSWYSALLVGLLVVLYFFYVILFHPPARNFYRLVTLGIFFGIVLIPIVLIGLPYFQVSRELQFSRSLAEAEALSATPLSFISVAHFNLLYQKILPQANGDALFPGAVILILAILGLQWRFRFPGRAFWILAILFFGILAFGPVIHLTSTLKFPSPLYRALYDDLPGFQGTRAPSRFFVGGMLGLALLAANGFSSLTKTLPRLGHPLTTIAVLALAAIECLAIPVHTVPIETGSQIPPLYGWLKQQPPGNVIEMPVQAGDIEPITRAMYFSFYHRRPLPVSYASFIPPTQNDFLNTLNKELETPSERVANILREFNVRYVIVHRDVKNAGKLDKTLAHLPSFESVYQDATHHVFQVNGDAPSHPLEFGCLMPTFATPNAPYLPYLVINHTRSYPITTQDATNHTVTLTWHGTDRTITQTQTIHLPYVLRTRAEGVPVSTTAPNAAGAYAVTCTPDSAPQPLATQTVRVDTVFQTDSASPLLELLKVELTPGQFKRGSEIVATFFWRRRSELSAPIEMHVQLQDAQGKIVSDLTRQPVLYTYPVREWRDNELVADSYALPIPMDAVAGNYHIVIEAIDHAADAQVPFRNPDGATTTEFSVPAMTLP